MMRTKQILRLAFCAAALTLFSVSAAWAQGSGSKEKAMKVNVGGEFRTAEGGKVHTLKVAQAMDEQGNPLSDMNGQTVKLAADAKTRAIAAKHRAGTKLIVKGNFDAAEKVLTVTTYKVDDGKGSDTK